MENGRKRTFVMTMIFAGISFCILAAAVSFWLAGAFETGTFVFDLRTLTGALVVTALFLLPVWDVCVSLRYFLGDARFRTKFFTFANAYALLSAATALFAVTSVVWNPFSIPWMDWWKSSYPMDVFITVCGLICGINLFLRFMYLMNYGSHKRAVLGKKADGAKD